MQQGEGFIHGKCTQHDSVSHGVLLNKGLLQGKPLGMNGKARRQSLRTMSLQYSPKLSLRGQVIVPTVKLLFQKSTVEIWSTSFP